MSNPSFGSTPPPGYYYYWINGVYSHTGIVKCCGGSSSASSSSSSSHWLTATSRSISTEGYILSKVDNHWLTVTSRSISTEGYILSKVDLWGRNVPVCLQYTVVNRNARINSKYTFNWRCLPRLYWYNKINF